MSDILHYYLDLLRDENNDNYGFHNILNTMKLSRHNKVCGEHFDGIDLKNEPLVSIDFSDDGENASSFRGCKVDRSCFLSGHSAPIESMEFIDDNTLVSRSANEVITWDIQSGNPIKIEPYECDENAKYDDYYDYDKWYIEFRKKEEHLKELLDSFIETGQYEINASSPDNRLVSFSNNHGDYIMDLKNGKIIDDSVTDNIVKVGKYYIYYDRNKINKDINKINKDIIVYDSEKDDSKPFGLNMSTPYNMRLSEIKNTNYLLVVESIPLQYPYRNPDLEKILEYDYMLSEKSYIIDVKNRKIVLVFNEQIPIPTYIPELDCLLIKRETDITELYSDIDNNLVVKFENVDRYNQSTAISKSKLFIAFSNSDFGIDIFSIKAGNHIRSCGGNTSYFIGITSSDRTRMICSPSDTFTHTCLLWNIIDNKIIDKTNIKYTTLFSFSSDGSMILIHDQSNNSINSFDTKTGNSTFIIHSPDKFSKFFFSNFAKHMPDYYAFGSIWWSYSGNFFFLHIRHTDNLLIYDNNGVYHGSISDRRFFDICISDNSTYVVYLEHDKVIILDRETNQTKVKVIEQKYICLLSVSDDGRYVTVVSEVDFDKAIIKTEVLDMHEKKVFNEEIIKKDYILLNYIRQFNLEQQQQDIYKSNGWTITVPSSPDNRNFVTAYLVPYLHIKNCDFRDCVFDEETKEIIRQYLGMI